MRSLSLGVLVLGGAAFAQTVPPRSFFTLPSSNGHGALLVDAAHAKVTHWREHLSAAEEPLLDAQGHEVWVGNQPQSVPTRDLLFDAYFGLRAQGQQRWLAEAPVTSSGYASAGPGGSGVVRLVQSMLGLEVTTYVFSPQALPASALVMVACAKNPGAASVGGVSLFSLHNFHLGSGRPGVMGKLGANGETIIVSPSGDVLERGFAGVVVGRPLGAATPSAWNGTTPPAQNGFSIVQGTTGDLVPRTGDLGVADDQVSALQFNLGALAANAEQCVGVAFAHSADPFADAVVTRLLNDWVAGRSARQVLDGELANWTTFQQGLTVPAGLTASEEAVARQSAVVLAMAQVAGRDVFLRELLGSDSERRFTRFRGPAGEVVTLPGVVRHRGQGAVLASLPPGEWTVTWVRDATFSTVAMAELGLGTRARAALSFLLDAEAGRFQSWSELAGYSLPPYSVSLTRYTGFGVEETDFNGFGPNLELDGFGLTLWALREVERRSHDTTLVDARWHDIATLIADPLVALVDPATGLVRPDSSIWETHWNGRQRTWTWTQATAARGLCDAAALADRVGDSTRATRYRTTAQSLRAAIGARLVDVNGALVSNVEELASGAGYFDVAAASALSLGLFAPRGRIANATLSALDAHLRVAAGPGWSRNDDAVDHPGASDVSPWGSAYDSAEWAFTDLLGSTAMRAAGRTARADALLAWVTEQSSSNANLVPETWDERTGAWKFNAPMVGFGAGMYVLTLAARTAALDPACGSWPDASDAGDGGLVGVDAGTGAGRDAGIDADAGAIGAPDGGGLQPSPSGRACGCGGGSGPLVLAGLAWLCALRRRR